MLLLVLIGITATAVSAQQISLSKAKVVVLKPKKKIMANAADMLRDEIEKRTRTRLEVVSKMPAKDEVAIVIGTAKDLAKKSYKPAAGFEVPQKIDGYTLWVDTTKRKAATVCTAGHDDRGTLFAVGRLLRVLDMGRDSLKLDAEIRISTAPVHPLRGHRIKDGMDFWRQDNSERSMRYTGLDKFANGYEAQAMDVLKNAPLLAFAREQGGSLAAIDKAQAILERGETEKAATDLRQRVFELAEALFQSIRMQHSVKKYHSQRYANLDDIDEPLTDRKSLKKDFAKIRRLGSEQERLARIRKIKGSESSWHKSSGADWPDWRPVFDEYQRKRSAIWEPDKVE